MGTYILIVFGIFSRKVQIILEQGAEMADAQESSQTSSAKARGKRINGLVRKVLEPAVLRAGSSTLPDTEVQHLLRLLHNTTQRTAISASEDDVRRWLKFNGPKWLKDAGQGARAPRRPTSPIPGSQEVVGDAMQGGGGSDEQDEEDEKASEILADAEENLLELTRQLSRWEQGILEPFLTADLQAMEDAVSKAREAGGQCVLYASRYEEHKKIVMDLKSAVSEACRLLPAEDWAKKVEPRLIVAPCFPKDLRETRGTCQRTHPMASPATSKAILSI